MNQAEVSSLLCVGLHETDGGEESYATECPKMNQDSSHETTKFDVVMSTSAMYKDHSYANACLDEYQHTGMMAGVQPMEEIRFGSTQHFELQSQGIVPDSEEESFSSSPETLSTANYDMPGYMEQNLHHINNALDEMVDKEGPVMLNPEFVMCDTTLHLEPHLTFSSDGFKIEYLDWDSCEDDEMMGLHWEISDIICIGCKWTQSVGSALITLLVGSGAETGNSGPVRVQFCLTDLQWPRKQQKIWHLASRYQEIWNNIPSDDFASENWSIEPSLFFPRQYFSETEDFEDVIYPKGDPDAVSISKRDVELLLPETFVNDTIIDFYIKFLSTRIEPTEKRRYHFFNSFFFRKLADLDKDQGRAPEGRAAFLRVRKWTRKINLFEKDFLFIPVNFNLHWSLIVICYPGEVETFEDGDTKISAKAPCILHMDSLKGSHSGLKDIIQSYLWEEWKEWYPESASDNSDKFLNLRSVPLELPLQDNSFGCGSFLLHYVELFLLDAPSSFYPLKIELDEKHQRSENAEREPAREFLVEFSGPFGFHRGTPRDLMSSFIGTMVCVEGIVTKCSLVRPKVVKSVHYCPATASSLSREYRDITSFVGLPTGSVYPTWDENGNLLVTEYGMCEYKDHQTLSMQEVPENSAPGQLPRTVDVIVEDDLVDSCKPGDRVSIVGVYKALPGKSKGSVSGVFRTVLIANNVSLLNKEANAPAYTREDLKRMKEISRRNDTFDLLGNSFAPSIYGHLWIKKAVVLLMLGGVEKNLKKGTHLREDINMMMVGDPSVVKSQLLRAVMNIAPLAISTTGRGSSGVGLTAAGTSDQETGERRLEAGAMVLADRGVVCIDEFDKMNDLDQVAIHEVMEQQTVTIAKTGIHASLNARCSVIAAAIFVKYDRMLHGQDRSKKAKQDRLTVKFLKKYIYYAKNLIQPKLTDEASDHIATSYAELRDGSANAKSDGGTLPITARTLETIIRLSTVHAKMKLRHEVLKSDVEAALQVLNFAIYHKELTEMEEREQREMEMRQQADPDAATSGGNVAGHGSSGNDPMDVDVGNASNDQEVPAERIEALRRFLVSMCWQTILIKFQLMKLSKQLIERQSHLTQDAK